MIINKNKQIIMRQFTSPKINKCFLDSSNNYLWFLKPSGLNRGRGIHVFNTLFQLESLLTEYYNGILEQQLNEFKFCP